MGTPDPDYYIVLPRVLVTQKALDAITRKQTLLRPARPIQLTAYLAAFVDKALAELESEMD